MKPAVYVSSKLRNAMPEMELRHLVTAFTWWKEHKDREYESPFFGKDSKLVKPTVAGEAYVMSHCHLIPKSGSRDRAKWERDFRFRARKTSDRVLFYVHNGAKFYLIDIADDPGAHEIMRMTDKQGRSFMLKCAEEADAFLSGQLALLPS